MSELLPCPFCGPGPTVNLVMQNNPQGGWLYEVVCQGCSVTLPCDDDEAGAIAEWNRRASSTDAAQQPGQAIAWLVTAGSNMERHLFETKKNAQLMRDELVENGWLDVSLTPLGPLSEGDRGHTAALREILAVDFGPDPRKLGTSDFFAALARIRRIACDALTAARDTEGKREALPIAAALARRLCQIFDSGGESQRTVRARHASAIFQLLDEDAPEFITERQKCDADPIAYLREAEDAALSSVPSTQRGTGGAA